MEHKDQQAIGDLFEKLNNVARQYPDRDGDAERLLGEKLAEQPAAPYYMAQTIVMQDQALADGQRRSRCRRTNARARRRVSAC